MAEMFVGACAATGFVLLLRHARLQGLTLSWWKWVITFLAFLYAVFVLEVVISFLREGTPKGAAVMGTLLGFIAVVWAVVLGRTFFSSRAGKRSGGAKTEEGGTYA
jgi:hypothetical protein